ncbi:MAG TPA: lipase maturation factor family protein [Candidatus Babeliales bacterium]|nr:lipase maturation factor family protein [Candidatus Babeliales bacterium]
MANNQRLRVSNPPSKPLLIWDGDCDFCRLWIERWRQITAGKVDYATYQEAAHHFPEIPTDQFSQSLVLIQPDGTVVFAAEAVYRSLANRRSREWLSWSYDHVPGFAAISETGYGLIARNRKFASAVTRLLWGKDVRRPTYFWAQRWFLRALGMIYLIAFVSLWVQVDGLVGSNGMSPVMQFLTAVRSQAGPEAYRLLPTLCWFNSSDTFLHILCGGGVLCSLLLIFGIAPAFSLVALFVSYLSLTIAGQDFFSFQWDVLLLEAGFLSIFFAPWRLWPRQLLWSKSFGVPPPGGPGRVNAEVRTTGTAATVSQAGLFLLKLLLFKLMLMSGIVKLTSGDDSWWDLTALDYHYWSQPLPTVFAWWADKGPEWFKHFSVAFCLVVEIIVPFFIWAPRRLRLIAAGLLIFLQVAIAITGNYCFFNLLTIALCLLLIDDSVVGILRAPKAVSEENVGAPGSHALSQRLGIYVGTFVIIVMLPINAWLIFSAFKPLSRPPRALANLYVRLQAFRIVNGYGLFREMTKDRDEIVLEGSADGIDWLPYEFKWKPGDVKRAPGWCAPHQPRLDWQMWFAALLPPRENPWLGGLIYRLLQGSHDVNGLLASNPFPHKPPRYVRAMFYRYRFTTLDELRRTGEWWKREELREYLPSVSLEQFR